MSFHISNISSQFVYNKYKNKIKSQNENFKKLSSGKRINTAADDAAGLAISEKLSSQTRGNQQAQRNVQDGISLLQTAEQGLSEINKILQRMRELAVQASNDTNTLSDRNDIQNEVNQLKNELNSISKNTKFNNKNLLHGLTKKEVASITSTDELKKPSKKEWELEFSSEKYIQSISPTKDGGFIIGGNKYHNQDVDKQKSWLVKINSDGEKEWEKTFQDGSYNQVYDVIELESGDFVFASRKGGSFEDRHTLIYKLDKEGELIKKEVLDSSDGVEFLVSLNENINGNILAVGSDTGNQYRGIKLDNNLNKLETYYNADPPDDIHFRSGTDILNSSDGGKIIVGDEEDGGGFIKKLDSEGNSEWEDRSVSEIEDVIKLEDGSYMALGSEEVYNFDNEGNIETINSEIKYENDWISSRRIKNKINKTIDGNYLITGENKFYKIDNKGKIIWNKSIENTTDLKTATQIEDGGYVVVNSGEDNNSSSSRNLIKYSHEYPELNEEITLQIGSNQNDNIKIEMADITTSSLDIENISLRSHNDAQKAIEKLDNAISEVSSKRSEFGSYQNKLSYVSDNLNNYNENLSSSLSKIEDADLAKQNLEVVRENILASVNLSIQNILNIQKRQILNLFNNFT